tara:strand:+ start:2251 stop:3171 length:921 start_codon:yes stop_codon:yes gene_type:complete
VTNPFGFLSIDKPSGLTSHDCVKEIRKKFKIKKVGHGGTLDPSVTGVLPIAIGNATRLLPYLKHEKEYRAVIQLGENRSTDDLEGEILSKTEWPNLTSQIIDKYLDQFRGKVLQEPPRISSIHIKGERAYKRARRGEVFTLPKKEITIHKLLLINWVQQSGQLEIIVNCSSGTYIRSLARDLGKYLNCGAYLYKLRRTKSQGFHEDEAIPLKKITSDNMFISSSIINPIKVLGHLYQIKVKNIDDINRWRKGQQLIMGKEDEQKIINISTSKFFAVLIDCEDSIAGIAELISPNIIQPKVVFNAHG